MYVTMSKSFWRSLLIQVPLRQGFTGHGNILTFTRSLDAELDTFEARNGLITKRKISQLLTLQLLNDSMEVSIKKFRKEVVDNVHQGFTKEFHSFKLITER